jgi:light-harvesting complex 1 beta chain
LRGYVGIFVVTFLVFLAVALASMLVAKNWRTFLPGAEGANSMWDGVTRAVYTVISQLS